MTKEFVVQVKNLETKRVAYYAIDSTSGGYPYFTQYAPTAELMSKREADKVLVELQRPNGPEGYPNGLLHQASGVNALVLESTIEVTIGQMVFTPVEKITIVARNESAKVEAEKARVAAAARAKLSDAELKALGL